MSNLPDITGAAPTVAPSPQSLSKVDGSKASESVGMEFPLPRLPSVVCKASTNEPSTAKMKSEGSMPAPRLPKPSAKNNISPLTVEPDTQTTPKETSSHAQNSSIVIPPIILPPINLPSTSYKPPEWAGMPTHPFVLETIRAGVELVPFYLTAAAIRKRSALEALAKDYGQHTTENGPVINVKAATYLLFGRLPHCDVMNEHPSVSREHCLMQFREVTGQVYLYDLGSAHGTSINKNRIDPMKHVELMVGDTFVLGASSRMYVFLGPDFLRPISKPDSNPSKEQADLLLKSKIQKSLLKEKMRDVIAQNQTELLQMEQERRAIGQRGVYADHIETEYMLEKGNDLPHFRKWLEGIETVMPDNDDETESLFEEIDLNSDTLSEDSLKVLSVPTLKALYSKISELSSEGSLQMNQLARVEAALFAKWKESVDELASFGKRPNTDLQQKAKDEMGQYKRKKGEMLRGQFDSSTAVDEELDESESEYRNEIKNMLEERHDEDESDDELYDRTAARLKVVDSSETLLVHVNKDDENITSPFLKLTSNLDLSLESAVYDRKVCQAKLREVQRKLEELKEEEKRQGEDAEEDPLSMYMKKVTQVTVQEQLTGLQDKVLELTEVLTRLEKRIFDRQKQEQKKEQKRVVSLLQTAGNVGVSGPFNSTQEAGNTFPLEHQTEQPSSSQKPSLLSNTVASNLHRISSFKSHIDSPLQIDGHDSVQKSSSTVLNQASKNGVTKLPLPKLSEKDAVDKLRKVYEEKFKVNRTTIDSSSTFDPKVAGIHTFSEEKKRAHDPINESTQNVAFSIPTGSRSDDAGLDETIEDNMGWVRPKNQKGDGKSHLNERYGY